MTIISYSPARQARPRAVNVITRSALNRFRKDYARLTCTWLAESPRLHPSMINHPRDEYVRLLKSTFPLTYRPTTFRRTCPHAFRGISAALDANNSWDIIITGIICFELEIRLCNVWKCAGLISMLRTEMVVVRLY